MTIGTIRIGGSGPTARYHSVFLDGQDITRFVRGILVEIGVDHINTVHLELVGHVELPDEIKAAIEMYRPEPAKEGDHELGARIRINAGKYFDILGLQWEIERRIERVLTGGAKL